MRKILVFQHVPFEPLGTLDAAFRDSGFRIRYINFDRQPALTADIGKYHGLVVLGGPMAADQVDRYPHLDYEREAILSAIRLDMPVLGICLGAQLIASAIGGRTLRGKAPEYGWVPVSPTDSGRDDPLIGHLEAHEPIFQWHADTFTLPAGAVHLAASQRCRYQAFRYNGNVYGFQFHLEANRGLIERWLSSPRRTRHADAPGAHLDAAAVLAETDRRMPRASAAGRAVFGAFIDRFFGFRRRRAHASR